MKSIIGNFCLAGLLWLCVLSAPAATHYMVPTNPAAASPYTSWETAGTSIIDVAKAAMADAVAPRKVLVTNGVYVLTNNVSITNIILQSVNGPNATIFSGNSLYHFTMQHADCVMDGLTVTSGWSTIGGGGILILRGTVTNCLITSCANADRFGAGVCIANGSIVNSTVSGNTNMSGGGGIAIGNYNADGLPTYATGRVENCIVVNNYVGKEHAGGIRVGTHQQFSSSVVAVVKSCLIAGNMAMGTSTDSSKYGGGVFVSCTNVLIANCTMVSNYAYRSGGGLAFYAESDRANIVVNCIIVSNMCGAVGEQLFRNIRKATGAPFTNAVAYSCSTLNTQFRLDVSGNTTNDPAFTNFANGNYRFDRYSPCFNSGTNQPDWMNGAFDLDGHPRICHGVADMGAYELMIPGGMIFRFQ